MNRVATVVLSAALMSAPVSALAQYTGGDVKDGGSISGVVRFKGTAPAPRKLDVGRDREVCAKTPKLDQSLIVNNGNLVDAVISITDIQKGKRIDVKKVTLDQMGCEYKPHVLAFPAGITVEILNPDNILHNVHSYSKANPPFNQAMPKFKKSMEVKIAKPEIIEVKCDVHAWMQGWLFAAPNPYVAVTDSNGAFKLSDVPPGTYTVELWHAKLGKSTQKVTVKAKEDAKISFEVAGK